MVISPMIGRWIDRYGAGTVLAVASAIVGVCGVGLSQVANLGGYYGLFVPGRACFAAPLELAPSTAISNWFIRRRPLALAILMGTQGTGLAAMPLVAQWVIGGWGWRAAWSSLGIYTLAIGVIPALLLIRRPEDVGLAGDPMPRGSGGRNSVITSSGTGFKTRGSQISPLAKPCGPGPSGFCLSSPPRSFWFRVEFPCTRRPTSSIKGFRVHRPLLSSAPSLCPKSREGWCGPHWLSGYRCGSSWRPAG